MKIDEHTYQSIDECEVQAAKYFRNRETDPSSKGSGFRESWNAWSDCDYGHWSSWIKPDPQHPYDKWKSPDLDGPLNTYYLNGWIPVSQEYERMFLIDVRKLSVFQSKSQDITKVIWINSFDNTMLIERQVQRQGKEYYQQAEKFVNGGSKSYDAWRPYPYYARQFYLVNLWNMSEKELLGDYKVRDDYLSITDEASELLIPILEGFDMKPGDLWQKFQHVLKKYPDSEVYKTFMNYKFKQEPGFHGVPVWKMYYKQQDESLFPVSIGSFFREVTLLQGKQVDMRVRRKPAER